MVRLVRTYEFGVEWIATNDNPQSTQLVDIQGTVAVGLLAALFHMPPKDVALDVMICRSGVVYPEDGEGPEAA